MTSARVHRYRRIRPTVCTKCGLSIAYDEEYVHDPDPAPISNNRENRGDIWGVEPWTENPPRLHPEVPRP